ncbi:hypothetical protein TRFO_17923 [Tritrichomonas foetus]|uniref:Uncharacterized protein n=1 Tax=Tritrichomonas foetus TaxID=1144522 RepID=A0A1J4KM84_9EUKA|nr:hypothetical protein TRFO_17923 [Tritrichomonas foetus]|eukprot:OHT12331.1 hypothetical protein TRFO_17923 [Tritrichomonas foetus]
MFSYQSFDPQCTDQMNNDDITNMHQLQQEIDRLREENNTLRTQFNEVSSMSDQLETIHQQNIQLTKQIRIANSERDDLQRRLDISLQRNEEIKKQREQEKITPTIIKNTHDDKSIIEKERIQWQNEKNALTLKNSELLQLLTNEQNKNAEIQKSITSLISTSNNYFQTSFSTIQEISSYIGQSPRPPCRLGTPRKDPEISKSTIDSLNQKIKKQRSEIKELKKLYNMSEQHSTQIQNETKKSKEEADNIITELEGKLTQLQHNFQLQELQSHHELQMRDNQIRNLQDTIHELQQKQSDTQSDYSKGEFSTNEINFMKKQLQSYKDKVHEYNKTLTQMKHENSQLQSQLSEANNSAETIKKRLANSETNGTNLLAENENIKCSLSTLQIEYDKLQEQYQTSISQIQSLESSSKQNETNQLETQSKIDKLNNSVSILESACEKYKNETRTLYDERDKIITILQKENNLLKSYEVCFRKLSDENKSIKKNLHAEQFKISNQIVKQEEIDIPYTSWFCKEFPSELCNMINDTAKNNSLPITTKLRYILAIIAKFYNKKLKDCETEHEDSTKYDNQKIKVLEQLLEKLSGIDKFTNVSVEALLSDPSKIVNISSSIDQIKVTIEEKESEITKVNDILLSIYTKLSVTTKEEALNTLDRLIHTLEQLKNQVDHQKVKMNKQKKEFATFKSVCLSQQKEIEDIVNDQQEQYSKMVQERDELLAKLKETELANNTLSTDISRLNNEHKESLNIHEKKCDEVMSSMKSQIDEVKNQYSQELNSKDQQIMDMQQKIQQQEKEIIQWKRTAELLKKSKIEKDNQLIEVTTKAQEMERTRQEKLAREKASLKAQFEQLVNHTKAKNEELRKLVLKTTKSLEETQKRNKELVSSCTQLSIENQQHQAKIEGMKEELEREHRLMDTKLKASVMSIELQTQNNIEELKSQYDLEKRNIFGYIATSFRQFFNASSILNEDSFKSLVDTVHAELLRLAKQDLTLRKILGITPAESIESHISKLLLDMYQSS